MQKILLYITLFCIVSCSLEVPVEDEVTGDDAIDDIYIASEALAGIYDSFPKNKIKLDVLADDFYPNNDISNAPNMLKVYLWDKNEIAIYADGLWKDYYRTINRVNVLQNSYPHIKIADKEQANFLKYMKAEALSLKALCYFDLVRLFAPVYNTANNDKMGIILKDLMKSESLPRSSLHKGYLNIEHLLLKAIGLFPIKVPDKPYQDEKEISFRWNKKASKALLAEVYLNMQQYQKAIDLCNELLVAVKLTEENYKKFWEGFEGWSKFEQNDEILFAFDQVDENLASIYDKDSQKYVFYPNKNISYQAADYRGAIHFVKLDYRHPKEGVKKENYLHKYIYKQTETELAIKGKPIPAIRTAMLYFIKAECQFKLGQVTPAKNTLNGFLSKRKSKQYATEITLNDLLLEKQREFIGEGHRFFDLKRNQRTLERVNSITHKKLSFIDPDDYRWLFPLAWDEINQNKNARQNPRW